MCTQKIVFTCKGFGGGISKMIRYVSSICVDDFSEVYLVHGGRESIIDIAPNRVHEREISIDTQKPMLYWRLKYIKDLRRQIKIIDPNIVCCFGTEQSVMIAFALLGLNHIKVIQCDRGDPYTAPILWKILTKWAFFKADKCVFQLEKQGKWYGPKIMSKGIVIPNAYIPREHVEPYLGVRKKNIVSVGRFVYEKRYEVLIDAFYYIHKKHSDYTLILYGEGPFLEKYKKMVCSYNLQNNVFFPGYTTNAMTDIKDASVFVLSSLFEGIPNTLIEAMAVGVPVVSTDCTPGGPDFLTNHGERGLLVSINNPQEMANAICKIIENPELSIELSIKEQVIKSELDIEGISQKWRDFLVDGL